MKPKTKTILFIFLSFVLGILAGWSVEEWIHPKQNRSPRDFQKMLTERLHLDVHQIAQVDSILETRRQKMDVHRKQMLAMRDTIQMEIRKVLNANQSKTFDAIIQELNERDVKKREHEPPK